MKINLNLKLLAWAIQKYISSVAPNSLHQIFKIKALASD